MKSTEYKQLKKQIEEQYRQAIALAEKKRIDGLAAIDTVWKMFHVPRRKRIEETASQEKVESTMDSMGATSEPLPNVYGTLKAAVAKSLAFVPHEKFTCKNVMTVMEQTTGKTFNYSSVSNRLKRLSKEGVIEMVKQGHGKSPSEYRLKNSQVVNDIKK